MKCDATADFCCKIESVSCSEPVRGYNNWCGVFFHLIAPELLNLQISVIRPTSEREVKPQVHRDMWKPTSTEILERTKKLLSICVN